MRILQPDWWYKYRRVVGRIIALMLGRLELDVDQCIEKYIELSSKVFQLKRRKVDLLGRSKDWWSADGKYRSESLESQFRDAAKRVGGDEDALLLHEYGTCKVFVCAQSKAHNTTIRLRTYLNNHSVDHLSLANCKIWEAARATSAAPGFFDPITIGEQAYVDGATAQNNPVEEVFREGRLIWDDFDSRVESLVSIGTGVRDPGPFGDDILHIVQSLAKAATQTEITEKRFYESHFDYGLKDAYFRFSVTNGMKGVKLDSIERLADIESATQAYLEESRVQRDIRLFLEAEPKQNGKYPSERSRYTVPTIFSDLYKCHHPAKEPPSSEVEDVLQKLLRKAGEVFIVIDGLDEASPKVQVETLELLAGIRKGSTGNLHILVASRGYLDIERTIARLDFPANYRDISMNATEVDHDINIHLKTFLLKEPYVRWSTPLKNEVLSRLTTSANGVFRWADLQIRALEHEDREKDIRRALQRLPKDLHETYERMLQDIEQNHKKYEALSILMWLAWAKRPLNLAEVAELVAFDRPNEGEELVFDPRDRFSDHSSVRRLVAGLVSFNNDDNNDRPGIVTFAHYSVLEYLKSISELYESFRLREIESHRFIFQCCAAYLSHYTRSLEKNDRLTPYPLLIYACTHLEYHAKASGNVELATANKVNGLVDIVATRGNELAKLPQSLLPGDYGQPFNLLFNIMWNGTRGGTFDSDIFALHIVALCGWSNILELLLDAGPGITGSYDVNFWETQTPLHSLAQQGFILGRLAKPTGNNTVLKLNKVEDYKQFQATPTWLKLSSTDQK
ncbi:unnamed protein product, partial [Clonostachys byssicola]